MKLNEIPIFQVMSDTMIGPVYQLPEWAFRSLPERLVGSEPLRVLRAIQDEVGLFAVGANRTTARFVGEREAGSRRALVSTIVAAFPEGKIVVQAVPVPTPLPLSPMGRLAMGRENRLSGQLWAICRKGDDRMDASVRVVEEFLSVRGGVRLGEGEDELRTAQASRLIEWQSAS